MSNVCCHVYQNNVNSLRVEKVEAASVAGGMLLQHTYIHNENIYTMLKVVISVPHFILRFPITNNKILYTQLQKKCECFKIGIVSLKDKIFNRSVLDVMAMLRSCTC